MNELLNDVKTLNKVGPKTREQLESMGITRISDLIHYYPRDYEHIAGIREISSLIEGEVAYVKVRVLNAPQMLRIHGKLMIQFQVEDETGRLKVTFFNQPYIKKMISQGETIILKGKYSVKNNRRLFGNPKLIKEEEFKTLMAIQLKPIYPLSKGMNLKKLTGLIDQAIEHMKHQVVDYLDDMTRERYQLASLAYAYEKIHYPIMEKDLALARRRLVFDEFYLFQIAMRRIREQVKRESSHFKIERKSEIQHFIKELPFKLTGAQQKALEDVFEDMSGETTMTRLVQGDVGSGKTIVATIALLNTVLNGYQGAFMAPTEVLAKQHYHSLSQQLKPYGVTVELLIGSTTAKEKRRIYGAMEDGTVGIIIGTHALIQDQVSFHNLALVITDEQHRFGVLQRESLVNKGKYPHTMVMSATPIPRTLALILYGDLDITIINEMPVGRQTIETYLVNSSYRPRIHGFIESEVNKGRQVYVVCPMVEEQEESDLKAVETYVEELRQVLPSSIRCAMLHGRMKSKEKTSVMEAFMRYDTQVLVSTTVIEVGVNVPNATLMVIENAERFGLAQLHQLRGRVGRGGEQSYCVLISDTKNQTTRKKLKFLKDHDDGFDLADYDLKTRGPGDAFGTMQHGVPFFRLADMYKDKELLDYAIALSEETEENEALSTQLELFYYQMDGDIGL